jgi:UDP-N-acetyl-D-glucosamine/UDP-N-acetyl-D-galactosamine dehydrogenase
MYSFSLETSKLAVIGLGYVGLPLAVEFGKHRPVVGFDISSKRIEALQAGHDATLEVSDEELTEARELRFSSTLADLEGCTTYIVTVPTPIDEHKRPDLTPLIKASETIGKVLKRGDVVIYESTVYPGATEEDCVPVLERLSGLTYNRDFFAGYSPERINPGDKTHRLTSIAKVTSGSTPEVAQFVDSLYGSIIEAGTHLAPSIRVAEAAKVIENTQRDVNIALINELAMIFHHLQIDTLDVLEAAGTKWNFLPFRPGLVGGHCIGVDPYYLTYKAEAAGYRPELVLSGRRINDNMGNYVVMRLMRELLRHDIVIRGARLLVLGFTFKENCPDIRNTRVIDIVREAEDLGLDVEVHDPMAYADEIEREYGLKTVAEPSGKYAGIIVAVAHQEYRDTLETRLDDHCSDTTVVFDLKGILPREQGAVRL